LKLEYKLLVNKEDVKPHEFVFSLQIYVQHTKFKFFRINHLLLALILKLVDYLSSNLDNKVRTLSMFNVYTIYINFTFQFLSKV